MGSDQESPHLTSLLRQAFSKPLFGTAQSPKASETIYALYLDPFVQNKNIPDSENSPIKVSSVSGSQLPFLPLLGTRLDLILLLLIASLIPWFLLLLKLPMFPIREQVRF
jgi:hypothetical protein